MQLKKTNPKLKILRVVLSFLISGPSAWATLTATSPDAGNTIFKAITTVSGTCDSSEAGAKNISFKISGDVSPAVNVTCVNGSYSARVNLKTNNGSHNIYVDEKWTRVTSSTIDVFGNVPVYETVPVYKTVKVNGQNTQVQTGTKQVKTGTVYQKTGTKTVPANTPIANPRQTITVTTDSTLLIWPDGATLSFGRDFSWGDRNFGSPDASFPWVLSPTNGSDTRLVRYQYSIGSSAGASNIVPWTLNPLNSQIVNPISSNNFVNNTLYYLNVRAVTYTASNYKTLKGNPSSTLTKAWYYSNDKLTGTINRSAEQDATVSAVPASWDIHFSDPIQADLASNLAARVVNIGTGSHYGNGPTWSVTDSGDHQNFTLKTNGNFKYGTLRPVFWATSVGNAQGYIVNSEISGQVITFSPCNNNGFSGGSGVDGDPYSIANVSDLQNVHCNLNKKFILMNDIDLTGITFLPIGGDGLGNFSGTFDGNSHTISHFTAHFSDRDNLALFGQLESAVLKNLSLTFVDVVGESGVAGLAADSDSGSTVDNCSVSGTISGTNAVGALVGNNRYSSKVKNSSASGSVNAIQGSVGGAVGINQISSFVSNSSFAGTVSSAGVYVGGLVGQANSSCVEQSFSTGSVNGGEYVGGLVGYIYQQNCSGDDTSGIKFSYSTATVTNTAFFTGGLVGLATTASISRSYATGSVSGGYYVGGLVGHLSTSSTIKNSYSTSLVSSPYSSQYYLGGLVGMMGQFCTVQNSYSTGSVTCSSCGAVGGLIGAYNGGGNTTTNSFWDTSSSALGGSNGGTGKGTDDMKTHSNTSGTFTAWDTSIWNIVDGAYPTLK